MHDMNTAIGILGGTFDPIHYGHLRTALELYTALDLAEVRLIPCYQPVHRKLPVATPTQRLTMAQLAVASEPVLKVDDGEIKRQGPSYTIDTLEALRTELPKTPLCLIMGIDALLNFPSWNRWEAILELAHLVIAHRPQYHLPKTGIVADLLKKRLRQNTYALHENLSGCIIMHPVTALEISATDIRRQIALGRSPRFLLPDNVYHYIQEQGVYSISHLSL